MSPQRKPDPEKYCEHCGKRLARKRFSGGQLECLTVFGKRKFCDLMCMAQDFRVREKKPDAEVGYGEAHRRARRLKSPGACERCGQPFARDVHHRNHEWADNSPGNLERICRSCHNREHHARPPCKVCGKPQKGLGYCNRHYIRFKRFGDPLAYHTPPPAVCTTCGRRAQARGLCGRHYMEAKRAGNLPPPKRKEVPG